MVVENASETKEYEVSPSQTLRLQRIVLLSSLMKGMPEKTPAFFSIVFAKTGQIDLDTFLKVKKLARASGGGIWALPERKGVFLGFLPLIHKLLCFISFQL